MPPEIHALLASVDPEAVVALMREVAVQEILSRFRHLKEGDIAIKSYAQDFVTKADTEAERVLTERLPLLVPNSLVLGEESVYRDSKVLDLLDSDSLVWVLDPLDGTRRFKESIEGFSMLVALVYQRTPIMGFLLEPDLTALDSPESQKVYVAVLGQGLHLNSLKNDPIRVSPCLRAHEEITASV